MTEEQEQSNHHRPSKLPRIQSTHDGDDEEAAEEGRGLNMPPRPGMQRYLIAVEYIGTRFSGAQQQLTCRTVVGVLEAAFQKFIGQPASIFCSSRTDAGVHALSNVFHVDVERISKRKPGEVLSPHEPAVVKRAVNHFLQRNEGDIMVIDVKSVPSDFHARYKALERTYFYRLLSGEEPLSSFEKDRAWHIPEELSISAMQKACRILVGCHDFSSFRAAACQAKSPIRTLDELSITEVSSSPHFPSILEREQSNDASASCDSISLKSQNGSPSPVEDSRAVTVEGFGIRKRHRCFVVTARARSFLYHQVRLLVGALKAVGTGDITPDDVAKILEAKTISAAPPMAPACGLYLGHVKYDFSSDS